LRLIAEIKLDLYDPREPNADRLLDLFSQQPLEENCAQIIWTHQNFPNFTAGYAVLGTEFTG